MDRAAVPLTASHSLKCGNAVLSFPVCNCFKRRAGIRGAQSAAEGL